ncbi:MAG: tRNA (adenosine(37)-N6)-threonylcarbamoyltransferase complex ATPase subunit type 1 TsaE [Gammaproteobacteria bacterium]|nr:tRNA (adenosine(37)-N6)-threonylcarbamoyltransferase complex ATPase subunit type 1 TsaE [Gammaproteobacteria bacterium]
MVAAAGESLSLNVAGAEAMERLGACLAPSCRQGARIYLQGELGAGKTTLVRGILRGLGHAGAVHSPSYAWVETYALRGLPPVYHLDLYRLQGGSEAAEFLGIREYFAEDALVLVEWPERAGDLLPPPDLLAQLGMAAAGRRIRLCADRPSGDGLLRAARSFIL